MAKKGTAGFCRKHMGYVLPFSNAFLLIRQQETLVLEYSLVPFLGSGIGNRLQEQRRKSTTCFCHKFLPCGTAAL